MEFVDKNNVVDELDEIEKQLEIEKIDNGIENGENNLKKKPAIPEERGKRRAKKIERRNSKEAALGVSAVSIWFFFFFFYTTCTTSIHALNQRPFAPIVVMPFVT